MKKLLPILLLSSCLILTSQEDLEIKGIVVNSQNMPINSASVSIPAAFLRTSTTQEGKFHLSLSNVDYKMDDVIEISSSENDEIVEMTIADYMELNGKNIVLKVGILLEAKNKKTIVKNKKEPIRYTESKKTSLLLNNVKKGNQISIKNRRGKTVFEELVEVENLQKKEFDLNYLKDGSYFFEIEKDFQIDLVPFTVSIENGIIYSENKNSTFYKPNIKVDNDYVKFSQLSLNNEPIKVNIYDNNSELLHTEYIKDEQNIQRAYRLEKGSFKFVITANNNEYETSINTYDD